MEVIKFRILCMEKRIDLVSSFLKDAEGRLEKSMTNNPDNYEVIRMYKQSVKRLRNELKDYQTDLSNLQKDVNGVL